MEGPRFVPITSSELGGAIVVNIFALLATIGLALVLLRATWLAIRLTWFKSSPSQAQEAVFFQTQLGNYASCLVIGMMFNAVSGIIGFQWLMQRGITEGLTCRIQVLFMQTGNLSTGYFTTAIAVHTFNSLVLQMRQSVVICRTTIIIGWMYTFIGAFVPFFSRPSLGYVYGASVIACDVRNVYPKLQFSLHIMPILIASLSGAILYSLIFLVLRGSLKIRSGVKLTLDPNARWHASEGLTESYHRFIARVAKSMLWYPVAYIALLIPYAVTRLFMVSGFKVPFQAVVFASVCWYSLSVVDVFLLYNTFRILGPAFDVCSTVASRKSFRISSNLEKYTDGKPQADLDFERKILEYRTYGDASGQSNDLSSSPQSNHVLLAKSSFDRSSGMSEGVMVGRAILSNNDYQWEVVAPPAVATSPRHLNRQLSMHSREDSSSSSLGLPAPPRQSRSMLRSPEPPREEGEHWLSHQRSAATFGHQSPRSPRSSIYSQTSNFSPRSPQWSPRTTLHPTSHQKSSSLVSSAPPLPLAYTASSGSPPTLAPLDRAYSATAAINRGPRPLLLSHTPRSNSVNAKPSGGNYF